MKKRQKIGTVILEYDNKGKLKSSKFIPSLIVITKKENLIINSIGKTDTPEKIKELSDIAFSSWFNKINEIELSDREKFEIVSEINKCEKIDDKTVKICRIDYFHQEIN